MSASLTPVSSLVPRANSSTPSTPPKSEPHKTSLSTGGIIGTVISAMALLDLIALAFLLRRSSRARQQIPICWGTSEKYVHRWCQPVGSFGRPEIPSYQNRPLEMPSQVDQPYDLAPYEVPDNATASKQLPCFGSPTARWIE